MNLSFAAPGGRDRRSLAFALRRYLLLALCALSLALPARAQDELKPWLGVSFQPMSDQIAEALGIENAGVIVAAVTKGSPAQKAGLLPGDLITAIDGQTLTAENSFTEVIAQSLPGTSQRNDVLWLK